jgi:threonine synthase
MKSYLTHLECTYCGKTYSADEPMRTCPVCGKVLYPRYDLDAARSGFDRGTLRDRPPSMWRYFEVMPVRDEANVVSLGEGFTPLLKADRLGQSVGAGSLLVKDEGMNPTASFKARGLSAAVSKAKELGLTKLTMPSAGNAGGALAAYAASAGMEAYVFMPRDVPEANRKEVEYSGAHLTLVDGLIGDAGKLSREMAAEKGLFDVSTLQEPYRIEGKKTMGYEVAEQMGWTLPGAIIYPTGGGTGIVGFWKAFDEMEQLGWIEPGRRPKLFCVQAEGCAPIVRAFQQGTEFAEPWVNAHTIAAGLRVPAAIGDYLILNVLRESGGGAVTVSDEEIMDWVKRVTALEGVFVCPEGAATAAALVKLLADGSLSPDESILLMNTGSGLKYLDLM